MSHSTNAFDQVVLDVRNLRKQFVLHTIDSRIIEALNGVSLKVSAGEHVALAGTSGAGKSSLLKSIYRTYKPTSGEVFLKLDDDSFVDAEAQATQPGFTDEVGRGDPFENAAFEQGEELGLLGGLEGALKALRELFPDETSGGAHQGQRFLLLVEEPLAVGHVGRLQQLVCETQVITAGAQTRGLGRSRARRCAHQRFAVLR